MIVEFLNDYHNKNDQVGFIQAYGDNFNEKSRIYFSFLHQIYQFTQICL